MAKFFIYETKNLRLNITPATALENYKKIVVTFEQQGIKVNKREDELDINPSTGVIGLKLDQSDTGKFVEGNVNVQVNITYDFGDDNMERDVTRKGKIEALDNLYNQEISNE